METQSPTRDNESATSSYMMGTNRGGEKNHDNTHNFWRDGAPLFPNYANEFIDLDNSICDNGSSIMRGINGSVPYGQGASSTNICPESSTTSTEVNPTKPTAISVPVPNGYLAGQNPICTKRAQKTISPTNLFLRVTKNVAERREVPFSKAQCPSNNKIMDQFDLNYNTHLPKQNIEKIQDQNVFQADVVQLERTLRDHKRIIYEQNQTIRNMICVSSERELKGNGNILQEENKTLIRKLEKMQDEVLRLRLEKTLSLDHQNPSELTPDLEQYIARMISDTLDDQEVAAAAHDKPEKRSAGQLPNVMESSVNKTLGMELKGKTKDDIVSKIIQEKFHEMKVASLQNQLQYLNEQNKEKDRQILDLRSFITSFSSDSKCNSEHLEAEIIAMKADYNALSLKLQRAVEERQEALRYVEKLEFEMKTKDRKIKDLQDAYFNVLAKRGVPAGFHSEIAPSRTVDKDMHSRGDIGDGDTVQHPKPFFLAKTQSQPPPASIAPPPPCPLCDQRFSDINTLERHAAVCQSEA